MSTEQTQSPDQPVLITPDFTEVQDRVEPGEYTVRITDAKVGQWPGKNGKKDTNHIAWTLETFGEADDKNNGRKIFHRTATHGPGAFRLQELYKAAMNEDCGASFDFTMLYGKEVKITVVNQKDKPEYTEVKAVKSISH